MIVENCITDVFAHHIVIYCAIEINHSTIIQFSVDMPCIGLVDKAGAYRVATRYILCLQVNIERYFGVLWKKTDHFFIQ
jgi:hypothetical protein